MRVLAFDTSTTASAIALAQDGRVLASADGDSGGKHGETLLPRLCAVLAGRSLPTGARQPPGEPPDPAAVREGLAALELIGVGVGPGSFTGLRVGLATAKGLALANQKPIVGVCSLRVLARGLLAAVPQAQVIAPLLDAHKGEVFSAVYSVQDGELVERAPAAHLAPEAAAARLLELRASAPAGEPAPWLLGGEGLRRYAGALGSGLSGFVLAPESCDRPQGAFVAAEALWQLQGSGPSDLARLSPRYLRDADAQLPKDALAV